MLLSLLVVQLQRQGAELELTAQVAAQCAGIAVPRGIGAIPLERAAGELLENSK